MATNLRSDDINRIARELAAKILAEAETKRVFKEAVNEWAEEKFAQFNASVVKKLWVTLFVALVFFVMWAQGYHK